MSDLKSTYLGLDIKNPIIASSSGFTGNVKDIIELEAHGAGAVVLKSLFEEEIKMEAGSMAPSSKGSVFQNEAEAYLNYYVEQNNVDNYLKLIAEAKKNVSIPVIASINCITATDWTKFAEKIQKAGADALELNIFILPSNIKEDSKAVEKRYFEIVQAVKKNISIPISLKLSPYFSSLAKTYVDLSEYGIAGIVLFNRYFNPDIDVHKKEIISGSVYSSPVDISMPLRWIGILHGRIKCDLAASSGIHDGQGAVKALLAGADVVYIASTLYINGFHAITSILNDLDKWMDENNYASIDEFRGILSQAKLTDPEVYERAQFMKYFSSHVK